jgi:transmembrane sensor
VKTSNVIPFVQRRQQYEALQEQACDWLARLDAGASEEERRQLGLWLQEDPLRAAVLFEMAALWDQMTVLEELSEIFPLEHYTSTQRNTGRRSGLALAAGFFGAMVMVGALYLFGSREPVGLISQVNEAPSSYETAIGEQTTVTLPDGSTVILNTNTHIDVDFTSTARNVYLTRGEGHFQVAKNRDLPFRVHAGSRVIEAVGTAFAVQHVEDLHVEVTVTEGVVNLKREEPDADEAAATPARKQAAHDEVIPLVAGEFAAVDDQVDSIERKKLQSEEIDVLLSWRHGMLLFQDEPLDQVLREVSRYTPMQIEIDDSVRQTRVRGYYRAGDVEAMLIALHNNFQIEVERVGENHVRLSAAR